MTVNRYEGLFILNLAGKDEGLKDAVDRVTAEIGSAGGKVETVQKMEKRQFSRVVDRKVPGGYYVNVIFEARPAVISQLETRFRLVTEVHRVLFTEAAATPVAAATPAR